MEIKDIEKYRLDKLRWTFYIKTDKEKDKDIEKEILDVFLSHKSWYETEKYLRENYDDEYYLSSVSSDNNNKIVNRVHLLKKIDGTLLIILYKGFRIKTFWDNNELLKVEYDRYELTTIKTTTIEDVYDWIFRKVKAEKRQVMNFYNKKIRAFKQEYKKELRKYNSILSREKEE